jgi:hypothetical protein
VNVNPSGPGSFDLDQRVIASYRLAVKYWEIIAGRLSAAGWSWGVISAITERGVIFIADAHKDDGKRYVVRSDQKLSAFLELEKLCVIEKSAIPNE